MNKDVVLIIEQIAWQHFVRCRNKKYRTLCVVDSETAMLIIMNEMNQQFCFNYRNPSKRCYDHIWNVHKRKEVGRLPKNYL
jgi:hypothetical protein